MTKNSKTEKYLVALFIASIFAVPVFAGKHDDQIKEVLSSFSTQQSNNSITSKNSIASVPDSSVTLDFATTIGESWDNKDDANNIINNCINGQSITGFEYSNITIETVGNSFISEAILYFTNSNNDDGLKVTVGAGEERSGSGTFNSNGILDITDNGILDVISLADNKFILQLYEHHDDNENAVDAKFTSGTLTIWGVGLSAVDNCPFIANNQTGSSLSIDYTTNININQDIGDAIEFNINVHNKGQNTATNVVLANDLSSNSKLSNFSCTDGTNTSNINDISSLSVQDIGSNDTLQCSLKANIVASGKISYTVSANADNNTNTSSNSAALIMAGHGHAEDIPTNNILTLFLLVCCLLLFARLRLSEI